MDSESSPSHATPPPPDLAGGPPLAPIPPPSPPPAMTTESGAALKPMKIARESHGEDEEPEPGSEASFNSRVIGGVIDLCVCFGIYMALWILPLPGFLDFIGSLASTAYFLTRDSLPFLQGQSIGKKAMRIKAVTLEGQPLAGNWQAGLVRNVFMLIWPVELFILWSRSEKGGSMCRLGDDYARTKVIVVGEEETLAPPAGEG